MHIHILGICGTFMGGIAAIARAAGHKVTGSDKAAYPPMSDQLASLGIPIIEGFEPAQLELKPDLVVVGNVMSRGMPIVEEMLNRRMPYCSGPQWLADQVLRDRWVIAVSGTHGKTTTASLVAWVLEAAGRDPGFLIGGVPGNFGYSARLGSEPYFVIEADEYDTAFFDKRAKFIHYGPRTLIINNLEFDHADIYRDLDAILWQFHQMLRILPGNARVVANAADVNIAELFRMGCWTPVETFTAEAGVDAGWSAQQGRDGDLKIFNGKKAVGHCAFSLRGAHNAENALASILACCHLDVPLDTTLSAIEQFKGVKRRMEHLGTFGDVSLYDDFAHHPTAIERSLRALKSDPGTGRVLVVLEPRSNTMKMGVHREELAASLREADQAWVFQPQDMEWSVEQALGGLDFVVVRDSVERIVADVVSTSQPGDLVVVMSNGDFQGIHSALKHELQRRESASV